jgi:hypothetical protein
MEMKLKWDVMVAFSCLDWSFGITQSTVLLINFHITRTYINVKTSA